MSAFLNFYFKFDYENSVTASDFIFSALQVGFNPSKDIMFMPCSGLTGANLREPIDDSICPWFKGPAFIPYINNLPPLNRNISGPFMMPIVDRYNDRGTIVMGKVESGCCKKGDNIVVMPNKVNFSP